jgi:hypothetical protein
MVVQPKEKGLASMKMILHFPFTLLMSTFSSYIKEKEEREGRFAFLRITYPTRKQISGRIEESNPLTHVNFVQLILIDPNFILSVYEDSILVLVCKSKGRYDV